MESMKKNSVKTLFLGMVLTLAVIGLAACTGPQPKVAADCNSNLKWDICPEAEVTVFKCYPGKWKQANAYYFEIGVKNITKAPQRYRVNLFLSDGKGIGGLLPRKGKPPVVAPGTVVSGKYPVKISAPPDEITVVVRTLK